MSNSFKKWTSYKRTMNVFLLLFSLLIFTSCEQDIKESDPGVNSISQGTKKMGDIILQKNVIILNDKTIAGISSITDDQMVLNEGSLQTDSIHVGSVIVGTRLHGNNIINILSMVTSISKVNHQTFLQTKSAELEEFIYSGTISGIYDPSSKSPVHVDGKMVNYIPVEGLVSKDLSNKIMGIERKEDKRMQKSIVMERYNFDKTIPLPIQQVGVLNAESNVNIKGGFTPKVDYKIKFSMGRLTAFEVKFIMDEISLEALAHINGAASYSSTLTDYFNIPITPIVLGPTGLILSPVVSAGPYIGIEANGKADLKMLDVSGNASISIARNPSVNVMLKKEDDLKITSLQGGISAEVGIEAKGAVALLFITRSIASSGLRGRVSASSDLNINVIPKRTGKIDVIAKIQAEMFYKYGISPFLYQGSFPLLNKEYPLYTKNFNF